MSLREDFRNYFCGTFIAIREGGILVPMKVEDVRDSENFSRNDYSDEHRNALSFIGLAQYDRSGRARDFQVNVGDNRLILESPDIGYYRDGRGRVRWVRYKPSRNRLKGVHQQKLIGLGGVLNLRVMHSLLNPDIEGLVNKHLWINPADGIVYYKGVAVGKRIDGVVHLLQKWQHLNTLLREYQIQTEESMEFPTPPTAHIIVGREHPRFDNAPEVAVAEDPFGQGSPRRRRSEPQVEAFQMATEGEVSRTNMRGEQLTPDQREQRDRQRGFRDNGRPVPMDGESFPSFRRRMDEWFNNN